MVRIRLGSRKFVVYAMYHYKGLPEALKLGKRLGLKEGTVRTWASGWKYARKPEQIARAKRLLFR